MIPAANLINFHTSFVLNEVLAVLCLTMMVGLMYIAVIVFRKVKFKNKIIMGMIIFLILDLLGKCTGFSSYKCTYYYSQLCFIFLQHPRLQTFGRKCLQRALYVRGWRVFLLQLRHKELDLWVLLKLWGFWERRRLSLVTQYA